MPGRHVGVAVTLSLRFSTVGDNGAPFLINIWKLSGVLTDTTFQFTVFMVAPANPG